MAYSESEATLLRDLQSERAARVAAEGALAAANEKLMRLIVDGAPSGRMVTEAAKVHSQNSQLLAFLRNLDVAHRSALTGVKRRMMKQLPDVIAKFDPLAEPPLLDSPDAGAKGEVR